MANLNIHSSKKVIPVCYAYTTPTVTSNIGWTKIGYTERDVEKRVKEQTHTVNVQANIEWYKNAIYEGSSETFTDKEFHGYLARLGVPRKEGTEWFKIDPDIASQEFNNFRENRGLIKADEDPIPYELREEQDRAVRKTMAYFQTHENGEFLWNAKPRFGKTLSAYDLCMRMGFENILVVTNRPAIANSWYEDYEKFIGANSGYYFVSHVPALEKAKHVINRDKYTEIAGKDKNLKGCIEFVSLQDIKGSKYFGGDPFADKLRELSNYKVNGKPIGINWDILIIDEAHEGVDTYKTDVAFENISRKNTLHLSGTPFKALANNKFPSDAIFNWTYADEQEAKRSWDNSREEENPYEVLPQLNLFTYKMSDIVIDKLEEGIEIEGENMDYAFDLNEFFSTKEKDGSFVYSDDIDKFLEALTSQEKFPFSTPELRDELKHTFWILDRVDSAKALARKLKDHPVFKEYEIILAAGDGKIDDADATAESYDRVMNAIKNNDKTITLSVGQLTTGVTIPQWTGVLMLSNMKSPSLYMQAAFRSQNPYLYREGAQSYRKENAYVFDFDPARSLNIFEEFANDLYSHTSGGRGSTETRKRQVRELLNFFPIYGEDEAGSMVRLDAEKVLTIPRKIRATEVVNRGFMSNLLFNNISNIFSAPKEIAEILNKLPEFKEGKNLREIEIDDETLEELSLDENNEVRVDSEHIKRKASKLLGGKVFAKVKEDIMQTTQDLKNNKVKSKKSKEDYGVDLDLVKEKISDTITDTFVGSAKEEYGDYISNSAEKRLINQVKASSDKLVNKEFGSYKIAVNLIESEKEEKLKSAKTDDEAKKIAGDYEEKIEERRGKFYENISIKISSDDFRDDTGQQMVETIEEDIKNKEKHDIENDIRDHLRGFARTIPSFLMAYGDEETTLESFDKIVPADVFEEVTSISLEEFRFLRDGGEYEDMDTGESKHFEGNLFDEIVFNDAIKEFLAKKNALKNYFDEDNNKDIFDYIPPQKTNQIYTPKKLVIEMVDLLEEENPGCFDDPSNTFADLYMKSGLYITEIVKRLYNNEKMKELYPDKKDRLNHIFAKQVYGLAPTDIIYHIALNYILGFSDDIEIEKHNLRKLDSLKYIQEGTLEEKLDEIFD